MSNRKTWQIAALVALLLATAACGSPTTTQPAPAPTSVAPSEIPAVSSAIPTVPAATVVPTQPLPAESSGVIRVTFEPGSTHTSFEDTVQANTPKLYVVNVQAGQLFQVHFGSSETTPFTITGQDGTELVQNADFYRGVVPTTQDYTIILTPGTQPIQYILGIVIPVRVSFNQGEMQTLVDHRVDAQGAQFYALSLQAGQLLEVNMLQTSGSLHLQVFGADGTYLQSGLFAPPSFRGTVPATQDYLIQVLGDEQPVDYTMAITVPQRIQFAPGATSASLSGTLSQPNGVQYVIRGQAGQTLQIVFTPASSAQMVIYGADGTVLRSGMGEGTSFEGELPSAQDYIISFRGGSQPLNYTLTVSIE